MVWDIESMHLFRRITIAVAAILGVACGQANATQSDAIQFNRDVRPILSAACFRCHGVDAGKREADLRLDDERSAKEVRDSGRAAVNSGDLDSSELWLRINSTDADAVMPPPSANRQLTQTEKDILAQWIQQGAKYQQHWSFESIQDQPVPDSVADNAEWKNSPIDRLLLASMVRRGLQPQRQADRSTLIRRVAFTLTGLPPTVEEVARFETDDSPNAYEAMVDRYLNSSAYGEEMARHWLDVARYGDTHGLHLDNDREMWAYRDWVVSAFNRNLPFDQFTIEQLAGDLLPNATTDQVVATGFNRCNVTTSEGGAIDDEFLFRYAVDRASTTAQTWLGLTAGCAVCHDHKYDPLSTSEFYSLYSFFYSNADPAMDGNNNTTPPFLRLPSPEQNEQQANLRRLVETTRQALLQSATQHVASLTAPGGLGSVKLDSSSFIDVWLDDEFPQAASLRNTSRNAATWTIPGQTDVPKGRRALKQVFGDRYEQVIGLGGNPRIIPNDPRLSFWVKLDEYEPTESVFLEVKTDKGTRRWTWADSPEAASRAGSNPASIRGARPEPGRWHRMELDDASLEFASGAEVQEIKIGHFGGISYWDGLQIEGSSAAANDARYELDAWWRSRKDKDTPFADGELAKILKAGPDAEKAAEARAEVAKFYFAFIAPQIPIELAQRRADWNAARVELICLDEQIPGTFVFKDRSEPRQAYVMKRGQYDQKGDAVQPGTPAFLPKLALPAEASRATRLDLAKWLLAPENPLTARVTVNRFWQQIFGVGLVKTSDDFGNQGTPPSHPELLDWLSHRFRTQGWNVKQLLKELVMTQAFQQSSEVIPDHLAMDPENRWLARGPRIRLDAEQIRDNALSVSGLLVPTMGGPGVKPYQPPNIWEPVGYGDSNSRYYVQDHGDALYRRSLYCYIKRTAPPPFMSNFDAPNREQFCTRRERSNTPLQALQLMNDVQYVEAARKMAERMIRQGGYTDSDRIRFGFRLTLARTPDAKELDLLLASYKRFHQRFSQTPADATALLSVGESPANATLEPIELAAMTLVANLILNLDETVTRN
jgi:Protein of unknown function (DUF1553)/Protein of unknown function (DUF1549)/Planctomycete cytochrome C